MVNLILEKMFLFKTDFFIFLHENEYKSSWPTKKMNKSELAVFISAVFAK